MSKKLTTVIVIFLTIGVVAVTGIFIKDSFSNSISCSELTEIDQATTYETYKAFNGKEAANQQEERRKFCKKNKAIIKSTTDCDQFNDIIDGNNKCLAILGVNSENISNCEGKELCELYFAATHTENCNDYDEGYKSVCLFTKSYIDDDRSYCNQLKQSSVKLLQSSTYNDHLINYYNKSKCLWAAADRNNDISICSEIPGEAEADICNLSFAIKENNASICDKLTTVVFTKDFCVELVQSGGSHPAYDQGILMYEDIVNAADKYQ